MLKGLLKDSLAYGIANAIQKLVPFFLVPIIIQQLGQAALKVYDVSFVYAYLFSWLFILGQDAAASVFYFDQTKTAFNKQQVLGYGFLLQGLFFLVLAALFFPFRFLAADALFSADALIGRYWLMALLVIPGHMLLNYALNILLWQKQKKAYVMLCLCQTIFSLASVATLFLFFKKSIDILFYCLIVSTTATGLLGFLFTRKSMQLTIWPFNKTLAKKLLLFGAPFAITSFLHQALPSVDRYFLLQFGYSQTLPQYILAVKLGGLVGLGIGAFALAFTPYSMAKLNDANAEKELSALFHFVAIAGFVLIPVLLLFKDWLVQIFAGSSFGVSANLLPFFFFGWMFDLFSYFSMLGIYKGQNSLLVLLLFGAGIIVVSLLNIVLIPRIGVYGAAVAFCLSKAVLFLIPLVYLRKYFKLTVDVKSFLGAGISAITCTYLLYKVTWYISSFILLVLLCGAVYYFYKKKLNRILFYHH